MTRQTKKTKKTRKTRKNITETSKRKEKSIEMDEKKGGKSTVSICKYFCSKGYYYNDIHIATDEFFSPLTLVAKKCFPFIQDKQDSTLSLN